MEEKVARQTKRYLDSPVKTGCYVFPGAYFYGCGSDLYLYGAQATAYGLARAIEAQGQPVAGYVVTEPQGNPAVIYGKRVYGIGELDPTDETRFLLAVPPYLHEGIRDILSAHGFQDCVALDGTQEYHLMREFFRASGRLKFLEDYGECVDGASTEDGVEIYVAKSAADPPLRGCAVFPRGSITVQAGAICGSPISAEFRDDAGENISAKNGHYDELTVTYWAWKNRQARVKGIAHYRRCIDMTEGEREALLKGSVDTLLPLPFLCWPDTRMQYVRYNRPEAVDAMLEAVGMVHGSAMRERSQQVLNGELLYNYNMLIARAEVFDAYCAWMFPVLAKVERLLCDILPAGEHTRVCGHLGELLLTVYFRTNDNLRIIHGKKLWFV